MASDDIQSLLRSGIQAARNGDKEVARGIFEQVIRLDARNEVAWLWLASVLENTTDRQMALEKVLSINPNNERAQQALSRIVASPSPKPAPAPDESQAIQTSDTASVSRPARPSPQRQGNGPLYYVVLLIALGMIGVAIFLLISGDDEGDTDSEPSPEAVLTIEATTVPQAATPRPVVTLPPGAVGGNAPDLPATWTPAPTNTLLPSATPTELPPSLDEYRLIFSGAESPVDLSRLWSVGADGSGLQSIEINLRASQVEIATQATLTPTAELVSPDEVLPTEQADAEESADATETADNIEDITETPTPSPTEASILYDNIEYFDPALSPDGAQVVFTAQIAETVQELFLLDFASGAVRQLTALASQIADGAVWSPDGSQIAFSASDGASTQNILIYVLDLDTEELIVLPTASLGINRHPAWEPSGNQLIYASDRETPGELEIYLYTFGESESIQLTDSVNSSFAPAISPDGSEVVFISNRGTDNDLYIMNIDGTNERLLSINDEEWDDQDPVWSPDGLWVVLSSTRNDARTLQLWVVNPISLEWQQVTDGEGASRFAEWFPNE